MATYIADTLTSIDEAIEGYAETVFGGFAEPLAVTIQAMGMVGLALIAANSVMQFVPIRFGDYIKWGVRYIAVLAVATSWDQFKPIYDILTVVPSNVGAELLAQTDAPNLNVALDQMVTNVFDASDEVNERAGLSIGMNLTSVIMTVMGVFMACIAIIITSIAKLGLATAISFAPLFITALLFRPTSDLFTSWTRFTIGFALIPVVMAGVMGAIIGVGSELIVDAEEMNSLGDAVDFLIVMLAGIIMMSQVPTFVNSLAGGITATASGIREARMAGDAAKSGIKTAGGVARSAQTRMQQAGSAIGAARHAEGGAKERALAALADGRATQAAMKENKERFQQRSARLGREATRSELKDAGHAGARQAVREQAAKRKPSSVKFAQYGSAPSSLPPHRPK